jgi:hypothetical protein
MAKAKSGETKDRVFTIPADKAKGVDRWLKTHPCSLRGKPEKTAIGGRITYSFTDTSIGQMQHVKCACGQSFWVEYDF